MRFAYADLIAGAAGEHLVCADLLLRGIRAFRTEGIAPYDVAAEWHDRLVRIQVKATKGPKPYPQRGQQHIVGYVWTARRGKGAVRVYGPDEADLFALVALDTRQIAYVIPSRLRQSFQILLPDYARRYSVKRFEDYTLEAALEALV